MINDRFVLGVAYSLGYKDGLKGHDFSAVYRGDARVVAYRQGQRDAQADVLQGGAEVPAVTRVP